MMLRQVGSIFFSPSGQITDPHERFKSRILIQVLFWLSVLMLYTLGLIFFYPNLSASEANRRVLIITVLPATAASWIAYGISRTYFYRWAALMVVVMNYGCVFGVALQTPTRETLGSAPAWLLVTPIMIGLVYSVREQIISSLFTGACLLALKFILPPDMSAYVYSSLGFFTFMSGLIILFGLEKKHVERSLRTLYQSEAAIIRSIPDLIIKTNREAICLATFRDPNDVSPTLSLKVGTSIFANAAPATAALYERHLNESFRTRRTTTFRLEASRGTDKRYQEVRITPSGETEAVILVRDITEQSLAEQNLQDSRNYYENIINCAEEGVMVVDENRVIRLVNRKLEDILNSAATALLGSPIAGIFADEVPSGLKVHDPAGQTTLSGNYEVRLRRPDGSDFAANFSVAPLYNREDRCIGWVSLIIDLTHRKEAEKLIEDQRIKIIEFSKLSVLGEMSAGIAHEINNPVAIIHTYAGQIKDMAESGELVVSDVLHASTKIESTAIRISKIVKSLRSLTHSTDAEALQCCRLKEVIDDTLELCHARFRNGEIRLTLEMKNSDLILECRPVQLAQVLLNLLSNAFDAVEPLKDKWVKIIVEQIPAGVSVAVIDSGKGIPSEIREKISQPFFTTKALGRGTGLGLSLSKSIVEGHGGSLALNPNYSNTCFVVTLPYSEREEEPDAA